jgi:hypothetical protein
VVIAKSDMPDGSWQEMLGHLRCLVRPPLLIVASTRRHFDYQLERARAREAGLVASVA